MHTISGAKYKSINKRKRIVGFTLIEMIAVILILAITTVTGTSIIIALIKGQAFVKKQSQVLIDSQLTMDRLAKQLRLALPFSLRETNGNQCLTFLPVIASGFYLDEVPDQNNGFPPAGRTVPINTSFYEISEGDATFLSIGANSSSEIYGNASPSLVSIRDRSNTSITLDQDYRWRRNSSGQRFFITDQAQAFCLVDNQLRYYINVSQQSSQVNLSGSYDLLMRDVDSGARALRVGSSNNCQHCVDIQLVFRAQDIALEKNITVALLYAP